MTPHVPWSWIGVTWPTPHTATATQKLASPATCNGYIA